MDKYEYFERLYSLNDSSDSEGDTNDTSEFIRQSHPPLSQSFRSQSTNPRRNQNLGRVKKTPAIHRTTSAPVPSVSVIKETPPLPRKSSLLCYDYSTQEVDHTSTSAIVVSKPSTAPKFPPERSTSTPNIGSVWMMNSTGIKSMLKKNQKRKRADEVKLVAVKDRVFTGKAFFYVPNDNVSQLRRLRISRDLNHGAVWIKEWNPEITHVVVDSDIQYSDVLKFLEPMMDTDTLPPNIALVNEKYTLDCVKVKHMVDPNQRKYFLLGAPGTESPNEIRAFSPEPQKSDTSFNIRSKKARKGDYVAPHQTPPRSQQSTQHDLVSHMLENKVQPSPLDNLIIPIAFGPDFDEMVALARTFQHLPIDDDDYTPSEDSCGSGEERSEGEREWKKKEKRKKAAKKKLKGAEFLCMTGGTGFTLESNPNSQTIEILRQMGDYYERVREPWKPSAYQRAIGTLKKMSVKVSTYDEAIQLPCIGDRLAKKIEEIVLTGRLRRLENAELEPESIVLAMFLKIYGVGSSQACEWVQAGYKTLEDLKQNVSLTTNQQIGIEHYHDFETRIPREEVTALGEIVKKAAAEIDPEVEAIIGGSYRRGATTSGDIDFILTKHSTQTSHELLPFLHELVRKLELDGLLVCSLAVPSGRENSSGSKWHGACVLPGNPTWRRIDFLLVPDTELGAALIYFTGDDLFNRSIRLWASKLGWRLNQRGLYKDVIRGPGREKVSEGELIEGADEKKIFHILGVPWRPPEERICR